MSLGVNEDCKFEIRDVWAHNLEEEMEHVRRIVVDYPYVAMDTEFPGVVARPVGTFKSTAEYHYQTLRCNVDMLKLIQLGLTFSKSTGELPKGVCTWQFNFEFGLGDDMYAQDSIDLLIRSGIDFHKHEKVGIDVQLFGELLITSGVVMSDDVHWVSFHGGYDFGYLMKVLSCHMVPTEESVFFELLRIYFPIFYDIKYLMKSCKLLKGGLQDVADDMQVQRVGPAHQSGSDSLLTSMAFFRMRELYFDDRLDADKYARHLFGLGTSYQNSVVERGGGVGDHKNSANNYGGS